MSQEQSVAPELTGSTKEAWNAWRKDNPEAFLDFRNLDLSGCNLDERNLQGALFCGAILAKTSFRGSDLQRADFSNAEAPDSDFSDSNLTRSILQGIYANHAVFRKAIAHGADFTSADLENCSFNNARLEGAGFKGAVLTDADFYRADLRKTIDIQFDESLVREARLTPWAGDRWSVIRRSYTGSRFSLNLVFLLIFFLPLGLKTIAHITANRVQAGVTSILDSYDQLAGQVPMELRISASVDDLLAARGWRRVYIWQILLGLDRSFWYCVLGLSLLLYNLLRGYLTLIVTELAEEEIRSGHTPSGRVTRRLYRFHYACFVLFIVSSVSFVIHLSQWITVRVWMPPS